MKPIFKEKESFNCFCCNEKVLSIDGKIRIIKSFINPICIKCLNRMNLVESLLSEYRKKHYKIR